MSFGVTFDIRSLDAFGRKLEGVAAKQLPFAMAKTLTQTAKHAASEDVPAAMKRAFDRPTRYTLNAFAILPATKTKLRAEILPRAFAGKGNIAWEYLDPEVSGGARDAKRGEKRLSATLGQRVYLVPAKGTKLDKSGNVSKATMVKVLSGLGALGDQSATKASAKRAKRKVVSHGGINGSKRRGTNSEFFVGRSKSGRKPIAIYQFKGRDKVVPVLAIVTKQPSYKPRLAFGPVIDKSVRTHMPRFFERNLEDAIRTAR
ncbi:hypothetical protein [Parvibaculum sp.]|uniref:hypothetical protein n=1 Tax=Parvibaculum sp. TaxID=2024848 RepID=UPI00272F324D|nr:hypothetical protein [Parvibaculum sp.]MDP1628845.1 hypothetical protein [Parvibaculum sp.]MDP2148240.1 hypothetical protein [Parvibaculum sp.]MDP3327852.1 hypothetical protein [Parvibaculum sp.]